MSEGAELFNVILVLYLVPFALGACLGSFLNVCAYRLPRGMSVVFPPSTCPACGRRIPLYRNIPVFTWLWQRGKTSCCCSSIPSCYVIWEIGAGLAMVALVQGLWYLLG